MQSITQFPVSPREPFGLALRVALCFACSGLGMAIPAAAQTTFPEKPVRIIVPSSPGGGTDSSIRIIAPKMSEHLRQPVVVENRPGAGGNIGAEVVARAIPDGYMMLAAIASHTSNPAITMTPYDVARDFAPVSMTVTVPNVLISNLALPTKSVKELVELARARPDQLHFASPGLGSNQHLAMEFFLLTAGARMIHVPYKGLGPALTDVIAGHVPVMMSNILIAQPHIRSGRVRAYGVSSLKRLGSAPGIPTLDELGFTGFEAEQWFGIFAPGATPREVINILHGSILTALQDPGVRERFARDGAVPAPSTSPEAFTTFVRAELARWAKVVREAKIQP